MFLFFWKNLYVSIYRQKYRKVLFFLKHALFLKPTPLENGSSKRCRYYILLYKKYKQFFDSFRNMMQTYIFFKMQLIVQCKTIL